MASITAPPQSISIGLQTDPQNGQITVSDDMRMALLQARVKALTAEVSRLADQNCHVLSGVIQQSDSLLNDIKDMRRRIEDAWDKSHSHTHSYSNNRESLLARNPVLINYPNETSRRKGCQQQ